MRRTAPIRRLSPAIRLLPLLALFLLSSLPALAWNTALDAPPVACTLLTSPSGETRLLLRPSPDWTAAWQTTNWTRTLLFAAAPVLDPDNPPPPLVLAPLAAPFDPATVTWDAAPAVRSPAVTNAPVLYTNLPAPTARYAFDLAPLFAAKASRNAFFSNGVAISPAPAGLSADSLLFRAVVHPASATAFAVGYIDSAPRYGSATPATVLWEQGFSAVGKVVLNAADGSECRALFTLPDDIAALPPESVASLVADFDLEVNETNGTERLLLFPLLPGPALERRRWEDYSHWDDDIPPRPTHGPSWAYADGPADGRDGPTTPWARPMVSYTNGVLGPGPWLDVPPVVAALSELSATSKRARFDLTPLWRDPAARQCLVSNGAIVLLDPAAWTAAFSGSGQKSPRFNLYRPDPYVQTEHPGKHSYATIVPAPALTSIAPSSSNLALTADNLDPFADFDLESTPTLSPPDWTPLAPADTPSLAVPLPDPAPPTLYLRLRQLP